MKREIPLFLVDTKKVHKKGECDFITCTDVDNGFVARIEYIPAQKPDYGDNYRIDCERNGLSVRTTILRVFGRNPKQSALNTLLKKAVAYYVDTVTLSVAIDRPSTLQCVDFIDKLTAGNRQYLDAVGVDYHERQTILTSLAMLDAIRGKLQQLKLME